MSYFGEFIYEDAHIEKSALLDRDIIHLLERMKYEWLNGRGHIEIEKVARYIQSLRDKVNKLENRLTQKDAERAYPISDLNGYTNPIGTVVGVDQTGELIRVAINGSGGSIINIPTKQGITTKNIANSCSELLCKGVQEKNEEEEGNLCSETLWK